MEKAQVSSLPLEGITVSFTAAETAIITSTYQWEENRTYYKSISVVAGETTKAA
jgi:hypothetical protein